MVVPPPLSAPRWLAASIPMAMPLTIPSPQRDRYAANSSALCRPSVLGLRLPTMASSGWLSKMLVTAQEQDHGRIGYLPEQRWKGGVGARQQGSAGMFEPILVFFCCCPVRVFEPGAGIVGQA